MKNQKREGDELIREAIMELLRDKTSIITYYDTTNKLKKHLGISEKIGFFKKHVEAICKDLHKEGIVKCHKVKNKPYYKVELLKKDVESIAILNGCSMHFLNVQQKDKLSHLGTSNGASVYLLFPAGDKKSPYIGYTGNVYERINSHCSDKKWVSNILFFMYTQDSTQSHFDICDAAYLEYKLIQEVKHKRNRKKADEPYLKPGNKEKLDRIFEYIKYLIKKKGLGYLLK